MKNIEMLLKELGIELTEEQKTGLQKGVEENYKPVADWQKQVDKASALDGKVKATEEALKAFDGVDAAALNKQIADLQADLASKDAEYQTQLADRDFNDLIKESIADAKGLNTTAIASLLKMDALKASKNQKEDLSAALKALSEAEDSKMLFGEPPAKPIGSGNLIGSVTRPTSGEDDAIIRAAMGLPPVAAE